MRSRRTGIVIAAAWTGAVCITIGASPAAAQYREPAKPMPPASVVQQVRIDQRLDQQVPLDLEFRDEAGGTVTLRECMDGRPTVLTLVYFGCPSLCTVTLNNLTGALRTLSLDIGDEFNILTVSFDPTETAPLAAEKKANYLRQYNREGAEDGWRFLTGDEPSIAALTDSVGFRYVYDEATGEYAHGSAVIILTPEGRVSHYLFGIEHAPKDLQLALVESSERRIGSIVDRALLLCYQYDPVSGRYGLAIVSTLRTGGVLTLLAIGAYVGRKLIQERRATAAAATAAQASTGEGR